MTSAFERLRAVLIERTGHHYYSDKEHLLRVKLQERLDALGFSTLEHYETHLAADSGEAEWRALEDAVTIGETYFFRYPDHFAALRDEILPRLIDARRDMRTLRIWSIGCSTGAEPYSVAILLHELLGPALDDWRVSIVGGDISERVLSLARAANYGNWALRTMGPADRARYFDKIDARTWRLKSEFRSMVRFERQNLLDLLSPTPPLAWNGFDLILCRNVLIYFSTDAALTLSAALKNRLTSDGALLLGHAEATLLAEPDLPVAEPMTTEFSHALRPLDALASYQPENVLEALASIPPPRPANTEPSPLLPRRHDVEALEIDALRDLADLGDYQRATTLCQDLIARDPTMAVLRYYEALLAQVCDDPAGAESALRRALYLDRNFILAHYRLGLLLLSRRQDADGRRELASAAQLAACLPVDAAIPHGQGVSAAAFEDVVRAILREAA